LAAKTKIAPAVCPIARRPERQLPETVSVRGFTLLLHLENCSIKRVVLPLRAAPTIQIESEVTLPNCSKFVSIP
jgi:hypothetical protein